MNHDSLFCLGLAFALIGCAATSDGPPRYVIPPAPPAAATETGATRVDPDLRRVGLSRLPASHTTLPPAGADEYGRGPAPTYRPPGPPPPGAYVAPNPSPVTGYGPGGMRPLPGSPSNPPYSYGP